MLFRSATTEGDVQPEVKEQINRDINMIYEMLQQNKKTIADLRSKLKKSNAQVSSLEEMINRMTRQMEEKDVEIGQLRDKLEQMNIKIEILSSNIETLTAEGEAKSQVIDEQTEALNTAYYVIGTKKELRDQNIITMEGGFAGIGRNKKMKEEIGRAHV